MTLLLLQYRDEIQEAKKALKQSSLMHKDEKAYWKNLIKTAEKKISKLI